MHFQHSPQIWSDHPSLVAGVVSATGITAEASVTDQVARFHAIAKERLSVASEAEFPEIKAWRRTFAQLGLKPTQYRCASESLLRRFRKEGTLPEIHPLIDLCNAISMAYAIPVAALDVAQIDTTLEVRHATGDERYQTFGGEIENPAPGEVTFVDASLNSHARRWTNRQSGLSAVRHTTRSVLIVAEALHDTAPADVRTLIGTLADEIAATWPGPTSAILSSTAPRFEF
jgi:DNA/RNA-binding domain of Phe-tRNA-synthetase-like protein